MTIAEKTELPWPLYANALRCAIFLQKYELDLLNEVTRKPDVYHYSREQVPAIAHKVTASLSRGEASLSPAIKRTAKALGIKPTMRDIKWWLQGNDPTKAQLKYDPKRWKAGTINVNARDGDGSKLVPIKARVLIGGQLAVHRPRGGGKGFTITHIPTGLAVRGNDYALCTMELALHFAERLQDAASWDVDKATKMTVDALAIVRPILDEAAQYSVGRLAQAKRDAKLRRHFRL